MLRITEFKVPWWNFLFTTAMIRVLTLNIDNTSAYYIKKDANEWKEMRVKGWYWYLFKYVCTLMLLMFLWQREDYKDYDKVDLAKINITWSGTHW